MSRRVSLMRAWFELVRTEARIASVVETAPGVLGWVDHDAMLALHLEAEELRNLGDDDAWKRPFNDFRRLFIQRDLGALRALAGAV